VISSPPFQSPSTLGRYVFFVSVTASCKSVQAMIDRILENISVVLRE
jgi:hypothetical protein